MRIVSTMLLSLAAASLQAQAPADDQTAAAMAVLRAVFPVEVEAALALSAAPEHLRAGATVYVYRPEGFVKQRTGTNGFSCLVNRDAFLYGAAAFKPTCWDAVGEHTYLPVMLTVGKLLATGASAQAISDTITARFATGVFRAPEVGGVAYMLAGDIALDPTTGRVTRQLFPGHFMFYTAGVTTAQLGVTPASTAADATLPFVFAGGAGGRHGLDYIIVLHPAVAR
jgi:hypothetical protein